MLRGRERGGVGYQGSLNLKGGSRPGNQLFPRWFGQDDDALARGGDREQFLIALDFDDLEDRVFKVIFVI